MIRTRDDCPLFRTAVPRPRSKSSVKMVFALLKDQNLQKL